MDGGWKPDARSVNVADLQATAAGSNPTTANYDPQQGSWTLAVSGTQRINLSYAVHLTARAHSLAGLIFSTVSSMAMRSIWS